MDRARGRSRAEWAELIECYEAHGESMEYFCREFGLTPKTFAFWRSHIKHSSAPEHGQSERRHFPELTERLVNWLADHPGGNTRDLSSALHYEQSTIATELQELEQLGILLRCRFPLCNRWYLG